MSELSTWSKSELKTLRKLNTPEKVQDFLDSIPYRAADIYPPPVAVLRDKCAHCFDGSLIAAAALRRAKYKVFLIQLSAIHDDDHMICAYKQNGFWGSVAKSNFPGLRFREPIFKTPRELVMSYFEFYFNMKRLKTLRAFSTPLDISKLTRHDWEWNQEAVDILDEKLSSKPFTKLFNQKESKNLRKIDKRLFDSQMLGVNKKGIVHT